MYEKECGNIFVILVTDGVFEVMTTWKCDSYVSYILCWQALATRDAMAKCIYGALFDWIVLKVNQALLAKKHNSEHEVSVM